jgi:hypothetical protein
LAQICLRFLTWDQELTLLHLRLQVIYQAPQVIWQVGQTDLLQGIWQGRDQMDHPQVIWVQVEWDLMDHPQAIWVQVEWDLMDHPQAIWQVDQNSDQQLLLLIWDQKQWDPMDLLQAWIWTETECLRHLQVVKDRIHYLVKVDQLVDRHQVICLQVIRWVNQDRWMVDLELQAICLLQTEWVICIRTWTTQGLIMAQKELLQEILDRCQAICQRICLHLLTTQMMVVR